MSDEERDIITEENLVRSGSGSGTYERDLTRGLAQRATEPEIKSRIEKGPYVWQQEAFKEGSSNYRKELDEEAYQRVLETQKYRSDDYDSDLSSPSVQFDRNKSPARSPSNLSTPESPQLQAQTSQSIQRSVNRQQDEQLGNSENQQFSQDRKVAKQSSVKRTSSAKNQSSRQLEQSPQFASQRNRTVQDNARLERTASYVRDVAAAQTKGTDMAQNQKLAEQEQSQDEISLKQVNNSGDKQKYYEQQRDVDYSQKTEQSTRKQVKQEANGKQQKRVSYENKEEYAQQIRGEASAAERQFQDDVSGWGKDYSDIYDGSEGDPPTLSSGVSPRTSKPRKQPWNPDEGVRALAYHSQQYGISQQMRRDGKAPESMGLVDDLPNRMTFESLNTIAGMVGKVQDAILHGKKTFEMRMIQMNKHQQRRVLQAWKLYMNNKSAKQQKLRRAFNRIQRGCLARCFYAWKDRFREVDKNLQMRRKVTATISRGCLKRCFEGWKRVSEDRWWKTQTDVRDREIKQLEHKIRGFERRPIVVIAQRRLRSYMKGWYDQAVRLRRKQLRGERAIRFMQNTTILKAWMTWTERVEYKQQNRLMLQKAMARVNKVVLSKAWNAWEEKWANNKAKQEGIHVALRYWTKLAKGKALRSWMYFIDRRKLKRKAAAQWCKPAMKKAFTKWYEHNCWCKRMKLTATRVVNRMMRSYVKEAWEAWVDFVNDEKLQAQAGDTEQAQTESSNLRAENERLRRDNERFVRLIDSGEWGKSRVQEIQQASNLMQQERSVLMQLVQSLRREYEALQIAKGQQEEELSTLKQKLVMQGGMSRNKMLVKGGSSFNAMVRALKQDLIETGQGKRDPNLCYEVEKLSLDKVQVFPDGELNVQAVNAPPSMKNFVRPTYRGSRNVSPHNVRPGQQTANGAMPMGGRHLLNQLKALSPMELDQLQQVIRQQQASGQQ